MRRGYSGRQRLIYKVYARRVRLTVKLHGNIEPTHQRWHVYCEVCSMELGWFGRNKLVPLLAGSGQVDIGFCEPLTFSPREIGSIVDGRGGEQDVIVYTYASYARPLVWYLRDISRHEHSKEWCQWHRHQSNNQGGYADLMSDHHIPSLDRSIEQKLDNCM